MLGYAEALELARSKKKKINRCTEYTNAYAFFYDDGSSQIGGDAPIVIMKDSGAALPMIEYATTPGKEFVQSFDVDMEIE